MVTLYDNQQSSTFYRYVYGDGTGSGYWTGHVFTAADSYNLKSIQLKLYKTGTPSGNVVVELYATSGTSPSGSVLATGSVLASSLVTSVSGSWVTFDVSASGYSIVSGTKYVVMVKATSANSSNSVLWRVNTVSGTGGIIYQQWDTWQTTGFDGTFMMYGDPIGWSGKINGKTDISKIIGTQITDIADVN